MSLLLAIAISGFAQRQTDVIDRGLVAIKTGTGVFVSWRILGEEYYDVKYNIYRDGTLLNSEPLDVSNYIDTSGGTTSSKYTVSAVVRGVEQEQCDAVTPWSNKYLEVKMDHGDLTSTYIPNDACVADVDGDGELEILLKFDNSSDANNGYLPAGYNGEYAIIEVYKLDGTKLWWIDLGPNMADFQNNENNIVAYDWDGDGKAEAVMRAADGTTIHHADGSTTVIGDASKNYRASGGSSGQWFIYQGDEFLLYLNGATGEVYQNLEYPLKRLESGETDLEKAWGDGYGHRSSKHFFGAPYLDGKKPSIFLARGIYTRHKMIAYDVDPTTHSLTVRWKWSCSDSSSSWYGQGYHNFGVADVDWDGRDEIVFGSMVIDDNGYGLSTSGLGHGDSQHCGDFDPYTHGQEIFACNEDQPNNNYRNATTSKLYYRSVGSSDDGRANMGNFIDDIPGAVGVSAHDGNLIGAVSHKAVEGMTKSDVNIAQNFRIYWDGDLCEESFNYSNGKNTAGAIYKASSGLLETLDGSLTNNDTKGTPCYQGDILGDWREEVIMRTSDNNIRIYSTTYYTQWRNYTLWADHQYRNAMVWQMCGYNQPPHVSYFLGKKEGITVAPPPLTMTGRTEIENGGTISSTYNNQHIIVRETSNSSISVEDGAAPYIATFNVPTWVQGHTNNDNITYTTYTCDVTGGAFTGEMRLIKQGDGILNLPNVTETYTGETNVWAGTLNFDGTMQSSKVWLNRFAELNSNGGTFSNGIEMEYDSKLRPGCEDNKGTITTDSIILNFGARIIFDIYSDNITADNVNADYLSIKTVSWTNGPEYLAPVFEFVSHISDGSTLINSGKYLLGEIAEISGDLSDIIVEGLAGYKYSLLHEDGKLYLNIEDMRDPTSIVWKGNVSNIWDFADTENFVNGEDGSVAEMFISYDNVLFDDTAESFDVTISDDIEADTITVNSSSNYTFSGDGKITSGTLVKDGTGTLTISNANTYTGGNIISGGTLKVSSLSHETQAYGNLGNVTTSANKFVIENGATLQATAAVETTSPIKLQGTEGGVISNSSSFVMNAAFSGTQLTKKGSGTLTINNNSTLSKLVLAAGSIQLGDGITPAYTVEIQGGTLYDCDNSYSYSGSSYAVNVPTGSTGAWYLDSRCEYSNKLTGGGKITVNVPWYRCYMEGDWSEFEGTIVATVTGSGMWSFNNSYGIPNATLDVSSGCTIYNGGKTFTIGKITGSGSLGTAGPNLSGDNTWKVGCDENFTWTGTVIGSGTAFSKVGSGKLTLSGEHTFTGAMKVEEGELHINSKALLGTGALSVSKGAILSGTATANNPLTNSSLTINGTLQIGALASSVAGTLAVNNVNVIFGTNSILDIGLRRCATSSSNGGTSLVGVKRLTMNGTIKVRIDDSYVPADGDSMIIWEATSFSGTPKFDLPTLTGTFKWDTSRISEGKLFVVDDPTRITSISDEEEVEVSVYSTSSIMLGKFTTVKSKAITEFRKSDYENGYYILRMKNSDGVTESKTVVQSKK